MKRNEAQESKNINGKTLIVAVDIGKAVNYGYFRAPNGRDVKPFPFQNNQKGFKGFWQRMCQFRRNERLEDCLIGFESTGPYAEPLFHFLRKKPVKLVQVNPMHTKRLKELTGNSPNKTDKKDPRVMADVMSLGHALTVVVPEGAAAQLRRLTQARERAIKNRTAMLNQLQHLIFMIFPEFLKIIKKASSKTAIYMIKNHPTPETIVNMGLESLSMALKRISRGKMSEKRFSSRTRVHRHS